MKTSINFWHLLLGDVQLGTLKLKWNGTTCTERNCKKFRRISQKTMRNQIPKKRDYAFAYRIISKALNLVPTDMSVENLKFKLDDNGKKATIDIKKLVLLIRSSKLP
jgi:hypothetical protein